MFRKRTARPQGFIEPCPSKPTKPPAGGAWIHEIKIDGYRLLGRPDGIGLRLLLSRHGTDWTGCFPLVAAARRFTASSSASAISVLTGLADGSSRNVPSRYPD